MVSGVLLILLTTALLYWARFAYKFRRSIEPDRKINPAYETIYLGMYAEILNSSNYYILAFLARRVVYAAVVILLTSRPVGQVFILIATSTGVAALIGHLSPYVIPHSHRLQMFNECAFLTACGMTLCFTQALTPSVDDRKSIGYALCALTCFVITINLVMLANSITW